MGNETGKEIQTGKSEIDHLTVRMKSEIIKMRDSFGLVLPQGVTTDRFVRVLQSAIMVNPMLVKSKRQTFFRAAMDVAKDGLLPDGKESAIVPMGGGEAVYMPMVAGIVKRIYESQRVKSIACELVYASDKFKYEVVPSGPCLEHRPSILDADRGARIGVYAVAYLVGGGTACEVMSAEDIAKFKAESKGRQSAWTGQHEGEMWKKTALKRLAKRLPMERPLLTINESTGEVIEAPLEAGPEIEEDTNVQRS